MKKYVNSKVLKLIKLILAKHKSFMSIIGGL